MIDAIKSFWHDLTTLNNRDSRFSVAQMLFVLSVAFSWLGEGAMRFPTIVALLMVFCDKQFPKLEVKWKSLAGVTLAFLLTSLLALFFVPLFFGLGTFTEELTSLARPAEILLFAFATLIFAKDDRFEKRVLTALFISLTILSILLLGDRALKDFDTNRSNWFFCDHCAFTGMYICNILSVAIYKLFSKDSWLATRFFAYFIWLVSLAVCIVTYARSVHLEFAAISLSACFLALHYLPRKNTRRKYIILVLLIFTFITPVSLFKILPPAPKHELRDNIESLLSVFNSDYRRLTTNRNIIWRGTLQKIKVRPWAGYGFAKNFAPIVNCYVPADKSLAPHAHNSFLHMCIRMGIPATCLFVIAHFLMLLLALRGLKNDKSQILCYLVANMIILRFVAGLTENFFMPGRFFLVQFWCMTVAMLLPNYKKIEPLAEDSCLVSVIVPAYNTARYIENSIQSVFDAMKDSGFTFEVIVTNDDSTDYTIHVLEQFKVHDNFTLVNQENKGVSAARNAAISHARGKYLFFLDSDDTIVKSGFTGCLKYLAEHPHVDMLYFDIEGVDETTHKKKYSKIFAPISHSGQELLANIFAMGKNYNRFFLYPKFCSRSLVTENNITFDEDVAFSEDRLWTLDALYHALHVRTLNELVVSKLDRPTSSCATPNIEKRKKSAIAFIEHAKKLSALPSKHNPGYKKTINCFVANMALWLCNFVRDENGNWDEVATNYAKETLLEYGKFFRKINRRYFYIWYIKAFGIKRFVTFYAGK